MNRLEDLCVDIIWQQCTKPAPWRTPLCWAAEFILNSGNSLFCKWLGCKCWFTGHQVSYGEWLDPDYCPKCFTDWPLEQVTLPVLLNRGYCWLVERDWRWFNCLDDWLFDHAPKNGWPSWWTY